jgi:hypothetical protein
MPHGPTHHALILLPAQWGCNALKFRKIPDLATRMLRSPVMTAARGAVWSAGITPPHGLSYGVDMEDFHMV